MTTKASMNHIRLCVSELARSSGFYSTVLSYLGYQLMEKTDTVQGWARPGPGRSLQWIIVSQAEPGHEDTTYDRGSPGLQHIAFNAESGSDVETFANQHAELRGRPFPRSAGIRLRAWLFRGLREGR